METRRMKTLGRPATFKPGEEVEVRMMSHAFNGAWYEALVDGRSARGRYEVVYNSLLDGTDQSQPLRETVYCYQIRPRPPPGNSGPFALNQPVEAFYNDGWWRGVVSKLPVWKQGWYAKKKRCRYMVSFPDSKEKIDFPPKLLRRRLRWVNGAWVAPKAQDKFINSQRLDRVKRNTSRVSAYAFRGVSACDNKGLSKLHIDAINSETKNTKGSTSQVQLESFHPRKKAKKEKTKEGTKLSAASSGKCVESSSHGFNGEIKLAGGKRKKTIPQKNTKKRRIMDKTDQQESILVNIPLVEYDLPYSSLIQTSTSQCQHNEAGTEWLNDALLSTPRLKITEKVPLPFEKRSPMWKYIDIEVVPKMKRHPHFRPLEQSPEVQREGIAIGLMVTYHSLMNSKDGLKLNSSCHKLDENLKIIIGLEEHGFEVQHLRARLEELVRIRSNHGQLLQRKSATEVQVLEMKEKSDRLNADVEATEKAAMAFKIVHEFFHERRISLLKQKEEKETIIARLQMELRSAKEEIASSERTFHDLQSEGW